MIYNTKLSLPCKSRNIVLISINILDNNILYGSVDDIILFKSVPSSTHYEIMDLVFLRGDDSPWRS